jgi:hypothetical protein
MESLSDVIAILRHEGREDLSALLSEAQLDFEYLNTGFPMDSDGEIEFVNAAIYAPIAICKALRELGEADQRAILDALQEVWPFSKAGGTYIQDVVFYINKELLRDGLTHLYDDPTGWQRVDRTMDRIRKLLTTASTEEHFQEIGVLCREGLISVAQAVFDYGLHPPLPNDNVDVSHTDVKRMIARYVTAVCPGGSRQEVRKCVNSAVDLANKVTHSRASLYRDAALCAQVTFNVVGLIALLSGKRDRGVLHSNVE